MISDADLASWLRQARQHVLDAQKLVAAIEQLRGSTPPVGARPRADPGDSVDDLDGSLRRRPGRQGLGPAAIHALSTSLRDLQVSVAIRRVLTTDGPLRARDVVERLNARGWKPAGSKKPEARRATVSSTLSYLVTSGALRSVNGKDGIKVYALAKTPADAARKLAAATARVNGTPRSHKRPTPPRPPTRASVKRADHGKRSQAVRGTDRALKPLILDALGDGVGATVPEILSRVVAAGWTTSAPSAAKRIAVDLSVLTRSGRVTVDNPDRQLGPGGERAVYRLAPTPAPAPDPIAAPTTAPDPEPTTQE